MGNNPPIMNYFEQPKCPFDLIIKPEFISTTSPLIVTWFATKNP